MTVDYLKDYALKNHEQGKLSQTMIVIDDADRFFCCMNEATLDEWIKQFLLVHRQMAYDVILICKDVSHINRRIRQLIDIEEKHNSVEFIQHKNFKIHLFVIDIYGIYMKKSKKQIEVKLNERK